MFKVMFNVVVGVSSLTIPGLVFGVEHTKERTLSMPLEQGFDSTEPITRLYRHFRILCVAIRVVQWLYVGRKR